MIDHRRALEVLAARRGRRVVVSTMGSSAYWPALSDGPLDFHFLPSSMGQGVPLGLGLALARPDVGVVVLCGDGSLLMNLGCLVTLAAHPADVPPILFDNGLYEVTGGQPVAGAGTSDFAGLARAAGLASVFAFDSDVAWEAGIEAFLTAPGPAFACLKVRGERGRTTPKPPRPMSDQIARLRAALGISG